MKKRLWVAALILSAARTEAAEIRGKVRLEGVQSASIAVGYVGKTAEGQEVSNMCGTTLRIGGSGWVQCDTFKPRISRLEMDADFGGRFRHTRIIPGRYLVWVRAGEHWYDVRWVTVKTTEEALTVDFRVNPGRCANLEALVNGRGTDVTCEPIDASSRPILDGLNAMFWLHGEQTPKGGRAAFYGLRPGRYLVRYGRARTNVTLKPGQNRRVSLAG